MNYFDTVISPEKTIADNIPMEFNPLTETDSKIDKEKLSENVNVNAIATIPFTDLPERDSFYDPTFKENQKKILRDVSKSLYYVNPWKQVSSYFCRIVRWNEFEIIAEWLIDEDELILQDRAIPVTNISASLLKVKQILQVIFYERENEAKWSIIDGNPFEMHQYFEAADNNIDLSKASMFNF